MAGKTLAQKMLMKSGMKVLVNHLPEGYTIDGVFGGAPDGVVIETEISGDYDFAMVFALTQAGLLSHVEQILPALKPDALFWIAYPKKTAKVESDLSRDVFWKLLEPFGFRPVAQVAVDAVWSTLRFRSQDYFGK